MRRLGLRGTLLTSHHQARGTFAVGIEALDRVTPRIIVAMDGILHGNTPRQHAHHGLATPPVPFSGQCAMQWCAQPTLLDHVLDPLFDAFLAVCMPCAVAICCVPCAVCHVLCAAETTMWLTLRRAMTRTRVEDDVRLLHAPSA